MTDRDADEDLSRLVAELATALRDLESELDPPERRVRPPSPRELRRFTSDVAIPGIILVLETNIRALRLLQRALEVSERADRTREGVDRVSERARSVSETSLDRLDDALADLEGAIEGRPDNDEAARLLDDARALRQEVQTRLREYTADAADRTRDRDGTPVGDTAGETDADADEDESSGEQDPGSTDGTGADEPASDGPQVDVDAELESIKAQIDDPRDGTEGDGASGADDAEVDATDDDTGAGSTDDEDPSRSDDSSESKSNSDGDSTDDDR